MKSSLMVKADKRCTCQKVNQLELKKISKGRGEGEEKGAHMTHCDTFMIKFL